MESSPTFRRSRPAVIVSLVAHAAVLALLVGVGTHARVHTVQPASRCCVAMLEVAGGSPTPKLSLPDSLSTGRSRRSTQVSDAPRQLPDPVRPPHPAQASATPPVPQSTGIGSGPATGSGSDAENATPAFPIFSPKPPVTDRALLPASEQQIVVDVNLSAQGDVVDETLVKGMGNALDQIVLDTVKTWRFHPATVNGNPVASASELIFPFNLNYPIRRS